MRAIIVDEFGPPDVLQPREVPAPEPGPGEVLINTVFADVMFLDVRLRSGWGADYFKITPPYVPGGGVGGTVAAVGAGVDAGLVGATVTARVGGRVPVGGYAERALAQADDLTRVPAGLGLDLATALVHDGKTALAAWRAVDVTAGDTVLITAASGGLGTLLTQLAVRAGAEVIAAVGSAAKGERLRALGASEIVASTDPRWSDAVSARPQVVFDGAGGDVGRAAAGLLADGGALVGYGAASGGFAAVDDPRIRVVDLGKINAAEPGLADEALELARTGELAVTIGQTFPLADAAEAHRTIEERRAIGRTLLTI